MARQILPVFVLGSDVDALKARLRATASATDLGVQACAGVGDTDRASWGLFYASVLVYCKSESSWTSATAQYNQGQMYEDNLFTWQKKLKAAGCDVTPIDPQPAEAPGSGMVTSVVRWVGLTLVVVTSAYVVHEVAATVHELLPARKA
jgi:hypothetical protein